MKDVKVFESYYLKSERIIDINKSKKKKILLDALQLYQKSTDKSCGHRKTQENLRAYPNFLAAIGHIDAIKRCKTIIDGSYSISSSQGNTERPMT